MLQVFQNKQQDIHVHTDAVIIDQFEDIVGQKTICISAQTKTTYLIV